MALLTIDEINFFTFKNLSDSMKRSKFVTSNFQKFGSLEVESFFNALLNKFYPANEKIGFNEQQLKSLFKLDDNEIVSEIANATHPQKVPENNTPECESVDLQCCSIKPDKSNMPINKNDLDSKINTEIWNYLYPVGSSSNVDEFLSSYQSLIEWDAGNTDFLNTQYATTCEELAKLNPQYQSEILDNKIPKNITHLRVIDADKLNNKK